ncbi:MAG: hypothetical protein U0Q19_10765 [Kineosporiaceae bacterium]
MTWQAGDLTRVHRLRVTTAVRAWGDLAASGLPDLDLVVLADAIRRREEQDGAQRLTAQVRSWRGHRGVQRLREALERSSDRVDSPMETRLRLLFRAAGLPAPCVNEWVVDAFGDGIHRPDLSWPQWRVAADYDGAHHLEWDADADVVAGRRSNWRRRQDLTRQDQLATIGWQLRVFTAFDVLSLPDRAVSRMRTTLRLAGAPV